MKAVFYTKLFSNADLSIGAKMVYSQLIFQAVICDSQSFDRDGVFDIELAKNFEQSWCGIDHIQASQIAKDLNIDPKTVSRSIKRLRELGIINDNNSIYIPDDIFSSFIELQDRPSLNGWNLLVYSFIWGRTKRYVYVDTYRAKLASFFCISETHLSNILKSLRDAGYIKRRSNGKHWQLLCNKQWRSYGL